MLVAGAGAPEMLAGERETGLGTTSHTIIVREGKPRNRSGARGSQGYKNKVHLLLLF